MARSLLRPGALLIARVCTICSHPQRKEIDRLIVVEKAPNRLIAARYDLEYSSVQRHKQAGHVAEALALYEAETLPYRIDTTRIFHRNCERLGKAQDAADRWLTDPEHPEQYDLGARAEEVTVHYEVVEPDETARSGFRTVKRKAKLHVLLGEVHERHGIRVTGFETKFSDPRRLLAEYSAGLRGELTLFMQAWQAWQEEEREKERLKAEEASAQADLTTALSPELLAECQAGLIEAALTRRGLDAETVELLVDEEFGVEVCAEMAARLVSRLLE